MAKQQSKPHFTALLSEAELKKVIQALSITRTSRAALDLLYTSLPAPYKTKFASMFLRHPKSSNWLRAKIFDYWLQSIRFSFSDATNEEAYQIKQEILSSAELTRKMIDEAIHGIFDAIKSMFVAGEEPLEPDRSPLSELAGEWRSTFDQSVVPTQFADGSVHLPWGTWSKMLRFAVTGWDGKKGGKGKFGKDDDILFRIQGKRKMGLLVSIIKNPATTGAQLERIYVEGLGRYLNEIVLATALAEVDWLSLTQQTGKSKPRKQLRKLAEEGIPSRILQNSVGAMEYLAVFENEILPALARNGKLPSSVRSLLFKYGCEGKILIGSPGAPREHLAETDYSGKYPGWPNASIWHTGGDHFDCEGDREAVRLALALNPSLPKRDLLVLGKDDCVSVALVARSQLKKRFK
jgi:hypothetical protein